MHKTILDKCRMQIPGQLTLRSCAFAHPNWTAFSISEPYSSMRVLCSSMLGCV